VLPKKYTSGGQRELKSKKSMWLRNSQDGNVREKICGKEVSIEATGEEDREDWKRKKKYMTDSELKERKKYMIK
jgi:hypothetical protein